MDEKKDYPIDRFLRDVAQAVAREDRGYLAELRRACEGEADDIKEIVARIVPTYHPQNN
jgi:hypothetical protein